MSEIFNLVEDLEAEYPLQTQNHRAKIAGLLAHLGYIPLFEEQLSSTFEAEYDGAIAHFLSDFEKARLISLAEEDQIKQIYGDGATEKLIEICLDVDEGIQFKSLPRFGDKGLKVRIIHYRVQLFGLYTGPIDAYYNASSHHGLSQLADRIDKNLLTTCNLLADLQEYTVKYLQFRGFKKPVSVFKVSPEIYNNLKDNAGDEIKLVEYKRVFRRTVKRELRSYPEVYRKLKRSIFKGNEDKVDQAAALSMSQDEDNDFVIRLIQIHQWMAGFYDGKLDGDLGPVTIASLVGIIRSYQESGEDIDEKRALVIRKDLGLIFFNTIFFLNKYKLEKVQSDKSIQTLEAINASYQQADDEQKGLFEDRFAAGMKDIRLGNAINQKEKQGLVSRAFLGIKAFFKKIFKFAKKLFGWIMKAVEKVASFISNFLKKIYQVIKEAAKHFIEGVKFLFGKTQIINQADNKTIITHFDIDKDAITISNQIDDALLKLHQAQLNEKVQSLKFSLLVIAFLFRTVKILLTSAAIALPILALKLAKSFKQIIDQYKLIQTI